MENENQSNDSIESIIKKISNEPVSGKEIAITFVVGLVLIIYCVAVWINPGLLDLDGEGPSGRGARKVMRIIGWIWNRPVASIGGFIGLLVFAGSISSIFKKSDKNENKTEH